MTTQMTKTIGQLLEENQKQLTRALPKHITVDKMIRVVLSEINRNKDLRDCTALSLYKCAIIAAQTGLYIDSTTGESFMIPFKNNKTHQKEAQLVIGYQGLLKLMYQSGQVANVMPREVYEKDTFSYEYGLHPDLIHKPAMGDRGQVIAYYVVATLINGGTPFEVMSIDDINAHMKRYSPSCGRPSSPWQTNKPSMSKKTLIRNIAKYLPKSSENLMRAVGMDEKAEIGIQGDFVIDGEIVDDEPKQIEEIKPSKADQLAQTLDSKSENNNEDFFGDEKTATDAEQYKNKGA